MILTIFLIAVSVLLVMIGGACLVNSGTETPIDEWGPYATVGFGLIGLALLIAWLA